MLGLRSIFGRKRRAKLQVGIAVGADQVSAVALTREGEGPPHVVAWTSFAAASPEEIEQGLRGFVVEHDLRGAPCRMTLSPVDYNLKLVERPANIPVEELADATRWLIRDLVEIDVESAAIAVLTIPDQRGRARTPHMFVAAARGEAVTSLVRTASRAGLACRGFEVIESAMLALDAVLPESVASGAMVRIDAKSSVLTLSSESKLFLARPLRVEAAILDEAAHQAIDSPASGQAEITSLLEPLLLDVQRSLDYYESEYGRAPATRLTLLPGSIDLAPLVPALTEALRPLRVEAFSLERCFEFDSAPPTREHAALTLACGAAIADDRTFGAGLIPKTMRVDSGSFGLRRALEATAALLAIMGFYAGHVGFELHGERAALAVIAGQQTKLEAEIARLEADATAGGRAKTGVTDPVRLRDLRDARLALLRDLGQRRSDSQGTFSSLLEGLARQDLEGVWLERIDFSDAGDSIELAGRALRAEDVPSFLRGLREEPVFAGRKFRTFEIERGASDAPGLRFRVATRSDAPEAAGGTR